MQTRVFLGGKSRKKWCGHCRSVRFTLGTCFQVFHSDEQRDKEQERAREKRRRNMRNSSEESLEIRKVVGSIPTLLRVFLCSCVGPFPLVGLAITWFIWGGNLALHITL